VHGIDYHIQEGNAVGRNPAIPILHICPGLMGRLPGYKG
jgi:hypothetical protein